MKMKKLFVILLVCFSTLAAQSPSIAGKWKGKLSLPGLELTIVFNIEQKNGELTGNLDSPDQGVTGIHCDNVSISGDTLLVSVLAVSGKYIGSLNKERTSSTGKWIQKKQEFPLALEKMNDTVQSVTKTNNRPQTPVPPFPYVTEEVTFLSADGVTKLAGTLTRPMGTVPLPALILVTGSGPQDRDETLMGHKPFLVLADTLTKRGLAVLRYDDRGVGKSGGDFSGATTFDFAKDAEGAFNYLKTRKDILTDAISIAGHSEGGMVAQILGAEVKGIASLLMLAAPGIRCNELLIQQNKDVMAAEGQFLSVQEEVITRKAQSLAIRDLDSAVAANELYKLLTEYRDKLPANEQAQLNDENINNQIRTLLSPWFRTFLRYDPQKFLEKISIPVFALNGSKDVQVAANTNIAGIKTALQKAGNNNVNAVIIPGLNHLFQKCKRCSVSEYSQIEETFSPVAIEEILKFLKSRSFIR